MSIEEIKIKTEGYVRCKSIFYSVNDVLTTNTFSFVPGLNLLTGEIDSGIFGISYLMSMYKSVNKKLVFAPHIAEVNGKILPLSELEKHTCYIDPACPIFSGRKTVRKMVSEGLAKTKSSLTPDEICEMFSMESFRFNRRIKALGNEKYQAMAAMAGMFSAFRG